MTTPDAVDVDPRKIDLLIVDDDEDFRGTLVRRCRRRGFRVEEASTGDEALELVKRRQFDVAVLDLVMPGSNGLVVLEGVKRESPDCEVIMLTGQGTVETAVQAMKLGAYDFLTKPFPLTELEMLVRKAYERHELSRENRQLRALLERSQPRLEMVGESPAMQQVFRLIERAGPTDKAILIQGESGTGKELVARALHRQSPRASKPLVVVNCASLSESLLESELFGHEKGAFTGATAAKPGLLEVADGGTLFIDEIGEMPPAMQAKLLRVLEDGSLRRVGSLQERRVDVRLISATNRDLAEQVRSGRFREDLYYRINVMTIQLPPLRERAGDLPLLVASFLPADWSIDPAAMAALERYSWPGNVRQLINVIERAKILAEDRVIHIRDLPEEVVQAAVDTTADRLCTSDRLEDVERAKVLEVLRREGGNKSRAARALGITRRSLYRLLDRYNLREKTSPSEPSGPTQERTAS